MKDKYKITEKERLKIWDLIYSNFHNCKADIPKGYGHDENCRAVRIIERLGILVRKEDNFNYQSIHNTLEE